jgi:CheY-like chemotaxis protein
MSDLKRILLVEDSAPDVELTMAALANHNLANEVVVARDGEEAIDYLYRRGTHAERPVGNPVVVLLDIKMPKLNGLEVLRLVKGDPGLAGVPIVMITSSREEPDLREAYRLGVNAYVVKPVDFDEFMRAVEQVGVFWALLNEVPGARRLGG